MTPFAATFRAVLNAPASGGAPANRIVDSNGNPVVDSNGNQVVKAA